jgi:hypothetical protein
VMYLGNFSPNTHRGWECGKNDFNNFISDIHSDLLSKTYLLNNRVCP